MSFSKDSPIDRRLTYWCARENALTEQRVIGRELEALLDAVEVTGLGAWERAKKLHGVTGLATGAEKQAQSGATIRSATGAASTQASSAASAASPVQTPLFEEAA